MVKLTTELTVNMRAMVVTPVPLKQLHLFKQMLRFNHLYGNALISNAIRTEDVTAVIGRLARDNVRNCCYNLKTYCVYLCP